MTTGGFLTPKAQWASLICAQLKVIRRLAINPFPMLMQYCWSLFCCFVTHDAYKIRISHIILFKVVLIIEWWKQSKLRTLGILLKNLLCIINVNINRFISGHSQFRSSLFNSISFIWLQWSSSFEFFNMTFFATTLSWRHCLFGASIGRSVVAFKALKTPPWRISSGKIKSCNAVLITLVTIINPLFFANL